MTLYTRSEEVVGTLSGSVLGVIAHRTFSDIIVTFVIAVVTGFLGAAGAHCFKLLKAKYLNRK